MADEADRAQEQTEAYLERARSNSAKEGGLVADGACHNCGATPDTSAQLFCDADCRQDYELRERQFRISGAA
jgi:hypothetical protein